MKEMMRYGFILALICFVAGGLLAGVNHLTKPRIIAQANQEQEDSLKEVVPSAESFEAIKSGQEIIYYKVYDKNKNLIGIAFKTSAKGYSSIVETLVGMKKDGEISAIKILNQNETPGLGSRVTEPSFTSRFTNKNVSDLDKVDAITGATISSKAVIESIKTKAEEMKGLISEK